MLPLNDRTLPDSLCYEGITNFAIVNAQKLGASGGRVQLLSARLGRPWQNWRLVSAHGVDCDAVAEVMGGRPVFFLTGGSQGPAALCAQLAEAGLDALPVTVGENLFCPDEAIIQGTAVELAGRTFAPPSVFY